MLIDWKIPFFFNPQILGSLLTFLFFYSIPFLTSHPQTPFAFFLVFSSLFFHLLFVPPKVRDILFWHSGFFCHPFSISNFLIHSFSSFLTFFNFFHSHSALNHLHPPEHTHISIFFFFYFSSHILLHIQTYMFTYTHTHTHTHTSKTLTHLHTLSQTCRFTDCQKYTQKNTLTQKLHTLTLTQISIHIYTHPHTEKYSNSKKLQVQ